MFLIRDEPNVLIDCGTPDGVEGLRRNLSLVGRQLSDIGFIVGTHCHYDHVGAAAELKQLAGVPLWLHPADRRAVEEGDGLQTASDMMYHLPFPATQVDRDLMDGQVIQLGHCRLTIVHTPGHTAGSVCVLAAWDDFTLMFAGDTVWGGHHPAFGVPIETWRVSLEKLLTNDFDVMVWGHSGGIVYGDAKRRVQEALVALGVYYVPWRIPVSGVQLRYGADPYNPGRNETNGVP
jgi:glyoxylase-like metal-dependent hydrolase (beta-lactamase superfamily II)